MAFQAIHCRTVAVGPLSLLHPRWSACTPRTTRCSRQVVWAQESGDAAPTTSSSSAVSTSSSADPGPKLLVSERRGPVQPLQLLPGETVFYEGSGAGAELALSLLLAATLIYIPLTIASIGKKLWIKYTFTNKRVVITNTSPLFSRTVQVPYTQIKEVRAVPRALGAWGDMVIFLKDGARLEIAGLETFAEVKRHIESCMYD